MGLRSRQTQVKKMLEGLQQEFCVGSHSNVAWLNASEKMSRKAESCTEQIYEYEQFLLTTVQFINVFM